MACPRCGSWAVRADRSLAGRMVCARCGEPLGLRSGRPGWLPSLRRPAGAGGGLGRRGGGGRRRLWLALAALLATSAVLAVMEERQPPRLERRNF